MESTAGGGGGGGGGPAPFLIKTYEMVDDPSTNEIVSWGPTNNSFIVWNPPDFAANLLPTYFKHNNFSSFIRQLNTYGFRKIDPERWEFSNDEFIKDHMHLLKNIHRRKPIHSHSHSHPPGGAGGAAASLPDSERMALEEEIDRLSRKKTALTADLWRFKQQQSGTKIQLDDLERRLYDMEQRQDKMLTFLDRALRNPKFVQNLIKMAGSRANSGDFSLLHKKRRLPGVDCCLEIADSSFYAAAVSAAATATTTSSNSNNNNNNVHDNSSSASKTDMGQIFSQDFCDKLKLGLCPAVVSDSNNNDVVIASTQSSNEGGRSPRAEVNTNGNARLECLSFVPDALELSDTGTSLCPKKSSLFSESIDEGDGLIACHLNLTLSSSPMQIDNSGTVGRNHNTTTEEAIGDTEDSDRGIAKSQNPSVNGSPPPSQEATRTSNQGPPAAPRRVNDVFWEQFLTERPGSSDTEEASSSLQTDPSDDQQDERKLGDDSMRRNRRDMEQLTL